MQDSHCCRDTCITHQTVGQLKELVGSKHVDEHAETLLLRTLSALVVGKCAWQPA